MVPTTTAKTLRWSLAVGLLFLAPPAFAYLDPSTGSMIISAIVGLFASAALALKSFWYRIKGLFRRTPPSVPDPGPKQAPTAPRPD
jgi:O-antigen/teichoic acid export membrane protein